MTIYEQITFITECRKELRMREQFNRWAIQDQKQCSRSVRQWLDPLILYNFKRIKELNDALVLR